jgi:hypothetical protein
MTPLAEVRRLSAAGNRPAAAAILIPFLKETLGLEVSHADLNADGYSLNSVNGILTLRTPYQDHDRLFFKFHQEEDEAKGVAEYYNSKLLEDAGWPVDVPVAARTFPGEAILLYTVRADARLADACRSAENGDPHLVALQRNLDRHVAHSYLDTLHLAPRAEAAAESLHQLFFHRLVDEGTTHPGGRLRSFYLDAEFTFPGLDRPLPWSELSTLRWRINGHLYEKTLGELFTEAIQVLDPAHLPDPCPAVLGHGDAHNANVWLEPDRLVTFDPAFAGSHLPALLAEIKPTFHNILAHPDWLYHPEECNVQATARLANGTLEVTHNWTLPPLRQEFLETKEQEIWKPLLQQVAPNHPNWQQTIRLALFCCPTLVLNLTAGAARHNPTTSLLGLSIALTCGSPCENDDDLITGFLDRISPQP